MSLNRQWFRKLRRLCWATIAVTVIFMAAFTGTMQLLLPVAGKYRENVEQWASRSFQQPIRIGGLGAAWRGFGPRLKLNDVQLLDHDGETVLARFDQAYIGIDLLKSLRYGALQPGAITIAGIRLTLVRDTDGTISVSGLAGPKPAAQDGAAGQRRQEAMEQWFLRQNHLAVEAGEIEWIDRQKEANPRRFSDVYLRLRNQGEQHQIEGFAMLPDDLGRRLQFGVEVTGNFMRSDHWRGEVYVQGTALRLPGWLGDTDLLGTRLADGRTDFKLWSNWVEGKPVNIDADVSAYGLHFVRAPGAATPADPADAANERLQTATSVLIDAVSGRFAWQQRDDGWAAGAERFLVKRADKIWPPSEFHMAYARYDDGPVFEGEMGFVRIEDLARMLLSSRELKDHWRVALMNIEPRGIVRGLRVRYQKNNDAADGIDVAADLDAVTTRPWKTLPGITGLTGSLAAGATSGHFDLATQQAAIDFGDLFRGPLPLNEASGRVDWHHSDDAWQIQTGLLSARNDDIAARGTMSLVLPDDRSSPFLDLLVSYEHGNVARTSRYVPVSIMPPAAVDWLDQAIVGGDVTSGGLVFRGHTKDFPFDDGSGRFETRFNVRDAIVDYARGWPRLEEVEAEVAFENSGMTVVGHEGKSFASTLDRTRVTIADFAAPEREVVIDGSAHGPTGDALRYLRESPLHDRFGKYLEGATASGDSKLDLALRVPLRQHARASVDANIAFENSTLQLAGNRVDITDINGRLGFTDAGLLAEDIAARLMGLPARISARSDATVEPPVTRFFARGNASMREFAKVADLPLVFDRVSGRTDWQAELSIRPQVDKPADVTLDIHSGLQGVDVRFPPPLGKGASTPRALRIVMALPPGPEHPVRIDYGDELRVVYGRRDTGKGFVTDRVALRFGGGEAVLPATPGIHVSGRLERMALREWNEIVDTAGPPRDDAPKLSSVSIEIGQATVFDRQFDDVRLIARRDPKMWLADVTSQQLAGKVQYPIDLSVPLVMDLEYLKLARLTGEDSKQPLDPRKLPAMRVRSRQFVYGNADWGALDLATSRRPDGMHIDEMKLDSPTAQIAIRGDWVVVAGAHSSSVDIKTDTANLGQLLKNLEYVGGIEGGKGRVELIALWHGPLSAFALEKLDGTLRLDIENGQILDIEPGAGRLFGLLSVQALPRRLSLDFSDLFKKGFGFDKLSGQFSIDGGNAYTEDFYLAGPAARIEMKGRVGLASHDYDQLVTVTPQVSSGLPVAGALAGGPVVGAAIFLAEKLFKPGIDDIVTVQYSVKGDWSNPVVERLPKQGQTGKR